MVGYFGNRRPAAVPGRCIAALLAMLALVALVLGGAMLPLPRRACAALALLVLAVSVTVLNQAPNSAYFWQTLQTWEQGRFIRFHGVAQWLGWLWPYAALAYLVGQLSRR